MPETTDALPFVDTPVRPPFDPALVPVLDAVRQAMPTLSAETLSLWRQSELPDSEPVDFTAGGTVRVNERQVPGPDGAPDITLLILTPEAETGPLPAIYHVHGSGMVSGDRYTFVEMLLPYVSSGRAIVVSVEYRLAPEHPDPALVEDSYAGLAWTARNADELRIDPGRLIILGLSAGGGIAAGTALLARDRAFPKLSHQVLICPMLDDRFETHSSRMLDEEGTWDRNCNLFAWNALLGKRRGGPDVSPYAAPARAEDLAGLPRTYIDVGSAESFRDEALTYARRLSEAGVSVDLHMWGGGFHGFDLMAPDAAIARASISTRDEFIQRALGD
ncbi:alpha/beta hydrolase [Nocardioides sp. KIGAM211]|uniref:Alpha/beta hydrolase n=1 Tax=Nocardioides luti TaxID=2761101 RepID=A0A7X0RFW4_9ACTN|nr:alpha/beta hydrolase [Nocardioides luti]MBB6627556.1 alpha/beta hydrolase [Nocardioides luti]